MPKGKPKQTTQANGAGMSKMDAVRRALAEMGQDAMPMQMRDYIKSQMGIVMSADHVSTCKSSILREGKARKHGPKPKTAPAAARTTTQGGISIEDVRAVKELADRIGSDKVRQLVEVLG